jgi:uncharacterized protein
MIAAQALRCKVSKCRVVQVQLTNEERNWAMAGHLSALVAVVGLPFGHVVGPLVVYLVKGGESAFVAAHARASLNYQLTISLVGIVAVIVGAAFFFATIFGLAAADHSRHVPDAIALSFASFWLIIGMIVLLCVALSIVFIIMGTIAASEGRPFTYPFAIRFVR